MATVADILRFKGGEVIAIDANARVLEATKLMNAKRVGALLVTDDAGGLAGILTERDLLTRVLAEERDPKKTTVADVMTREVFCAKPDTDIDALRAVFREKRIRHAPVRDDRGRVCGMVSIGDTNAIITQSITATMHVLEEYISRG
jgi:CBS domain-containing protein